MNDFQIISKLGEGAYSTVFKARRLVDGNIYALKKVKLSNLSDKEKQNALNEVRILASIKSNYVVSYKEAFFEENENCLGIVMEYADKGDLYQKISEFKKAGIFFEESDIWRIFIQMVRGLKSLHELKILHRDLKSANIFLLNDGTAKLGDMNVSKVARRGLGYTQTGTPYYASPEVWKDQPYDSKSDMWSLGCVLYEMTALKPPFRAENMEGLYKKVIGGNVPKIPERFSNDLWEIIKGLLNVQPETRLSCDQILRHPAILKRIETIKTIEEKEDSNLLSTIRIPKNLLSLTERLPKANYSKSVNNPHSFKKIDQLPDIRVQKKSKKRMMKSSDIIEADENQAEEDKNIVQIITEPKKNEAKSPQLIINDYNSKNNNSEIKQTVQENKINKKEKKEVNIERIIEEKKNLVLPSINSEQLKYELPPLVKEKNRPIKEKPIYEYKQQKNLIDKQNVNIKNMPYLNNDGIQNLYKYNSNSPKNGNQKLVLNYYNGHNVKKEQYQSQINRKLPNVPNRKLSPIKNQIIKA